MGELNRVTPFALGNLFDARRASIPLHGYANILDFFAFDREIIQRLKGSTMRFRVISSQCA